MKKRLRVRRLTLAPAARSENDETVVSVALPEEDHFLAMEHLNRVSVVAQAATARPGPHVHGVENFRGSRFWALETESDSSDEESVVSFDTPEFIKQVQEVGFTTPQMMDAEKELDDCPSAEQPKEGTLAKKIIDAMVRHRKDPQPWRGPLPAPRVSPPRTFGDAMASAKVCCKSSSHPHRNSRIQVAPSMISSLVRSSPALETVQPSRFALSGDLGRDLGKMTDSISEYISNSKLDVPMGPSPSEGPKQMWLRLSVPYRPAYRWSHHIVFTYRHKDS